MHVKNKSTIVLDRHGFENEYRQLSTAYDIANDKIVNNIFMDSVTGKVYKCVGVKYINSHMGCFMISYTFECIYIQVPVTYFEDMSEDITFNGPPSWEVKGRPDD